MALTFFPSNRVKVFPCAYRGQYKTTDNQVGLYDPESRLNTEYNFVHSSNDWKQSYIIDWVLEAGTSPETYLLKCVIGGYYFEISGCTKDDFIDGNTIRNLYIKLTHETLRPAIYDVSTLVDKERKTYRLAAFEDSSNVLVNLDDDAGYFRGIKLSSTDITDTIKLAVFTQDGTINSSAFLPNISSGSGHSGTEGKSNSIQTESNTASGEKSFAIGDNTIAEGKASFSAGTVTSEAHKIIIGIITNVDKPNKQITVDKQNPITINVNDKIKINNTNYTINNISGQIITFNEDISDDVVAENKIYLLYTPKASEENSIVFGENGLAKGKNSFVAGQDLIAEASNQTVLGKYNLNNAADLFVVGNGTEDNRHNAIEIGSNTKINTDLIINDSVKNTHLTIPDEEGTEDENHIIATREWAVGSTASDSGTCVKRTGDTMSGTLAFSVGYPTPYFSADQNGSTLKITQTPTWMYGLHIGLETKETAAGAPIIEVDPETTLGTSSGDYQNPDGFYFGEINTKRLRLGVKSSLNSGILYDLQNKQVQLSSPNPQSSISFTHTIKLPFGTTATETKTETLATREWVYDQHLYKHHIALYDTKKLESSNTSLPFEIVALNTETVFLKHWKINGALSNIKFHIEVGATAEEVVATLVITCGRLTLTGTAKYKDSSTFTDYTITGDNLTTIINNINNGIYPTVKITNISTDYKFLLTATCFGYGVPVSWPFIHFYITSLSDHQITLQDFKNYCENYWANNLIISGWTDYFGAYSTFYSGKVSSQLIRKTIIDNEPQYYIKRIRDTGYTPSGGLYYYNEDSIAVADTTYLYLGATIE